VNKVTATQFWKENDLPRFFARKPSELRLPAPEEKKAVVGEVKEEEGGSKAMRLVPGGGKGMSDPSSTSSDDDGNWKQPTPTKQENEEGAVEDVSGLMLCVGAPPSLIPLTIQVPEPELTEEDDYYPNYVAVAKEALLDQTEDYIVAKKVRLDNKPGKPWLVIIDEGLMRVAGEDMAVDADVTVNFPN
jgi:hypothetical protein